MATAQDVPALPGLHEPPVPSTEVTAVEREQAELSRPAHGHHDQLAHHDKVEASRASSASANDEKAATPQSADISEKPLERSATQASQDQYLPPLQMALVLVGCLSYVFLVSLDQTILGTATPEITNQFNSATDIGWYTSAYLMTSTALQPLYGRMYAAFSIKYTYISSLLFFELGSVLCGAATSSKMFIAGRAIAGLGVAGGYIGTLIIISTSAPIEKRALYSGFVGMIYGVAAIAGPLIGGALTSNVTWRWCFYINLPAAVPVLVTMVFFFRPVKRVSELSITQRLVRVDWIGTALMLGSIVCLLLVLQDGGVTYPWSDSKAIGLIIGFVVIQIVFWGLQVYLGERATIPTRMFKNRTITLGAMANFAIGASFFTNIAFISVWHQAIAGASAINSGVRTLPMIVALIIFVAGVGALLPAIGYVTPVLVICSALASIGSGLLTILDPGSTARLWIPFQIIFGLGAGGAFQLPYLAAQTVLRGHDVEIGSAVVIFFQTLGGCIAASIGQALFANLTLGRLREVPGINPLAVFGAGASGFRQIVGEAQLAAVLDAYNYGIVSTFYIGAVALAIGAIVSVGIPLKRFVNTGSVAPAA